MTNNILLSLLFVFRLLDTSCGLPENNVRDAIMLPDGQMCIRTTSALTLYDGCRMKTYPYNPVRIPYQEYSGFDYTAYDESSGLILCSGCNSCWAFDPASGEYDYDTVRVPFGDTRDDVPAGLPADAGKSSRCEVLRCQDGDLWIMTDKAIFRQDHKTGAFDNSLVPPIGPSDLYTSIALDGEGRLWIGTARSGVSIVDNAAGTCTTLPYLECTDGRRIDHHSDISRIYADPEGGIWVATMTEGIAYYNPSLFRVSNINNSTLQNCTMKDEGVKCLLEDSDGTILVGTIRGLLRYDPVSGMMTVPFPALSQELCISLFKDSAGRIFLGTFYNGFYIIDGKPIRHFTYPCNLSVDLSYQESRPNTNCVRGFLEDSAGNFWISVYGGAGRLDTSDGSIEMLRDEHPELSRYMIVRQMREDMPGQISCCGENGSFVYDSLTDSVVSDLSSEWAYERRNVVETSFIPGKVLTNYIKRSDSEIWATAENEIFLCRDGNVTIFNSDDGIDCGSFFQNASLLHSSGKLYFGASGGICVVDPSDLHGQDPGHIPVIISPTEGDFRLKQSDFPFEISFSALDFTGSRHVKYRYMLKGFESDFTQSVLPQTRYNYLPAGSYTFVVQSSSCDGVWSDTAKMNFSVAPAFWLSGWAFVIYSGIIVIVIFAIWQIQRKSAARKYAARLEADKRAQKDELDQMKMRFFFNVSHELRTPLSLITLPVESLLKEHDDPRLHAIKRNSADLLQLVNDLLDFRRLEMKGEKLNLSTGDFGEFVSNAIETLREAARAKNITIEFENNLKNPLVSFDASKVSKMIRNLVSNAVKYTPGGGYVCVCVSNPDYSHVLLSVRDTGCGIAEQDLERIFDRFYRSTNAESTSGSGIGLNIVKQYAEMMGGSVNCQSRPGEGSTFNVIIPVAEAVRNEKFSEDIRDKVDAPSDNDDTAVRKAKILMVDDNDEFRAYLSSELEAAGFTVFQARDGEQALCTCTTVAPDIVVTDLMMPGVDGLEFTRRLKSNLETSHLPVILLTARTAEDIRLESYETGADAYLTKPFIMEMLLARITNLVEDRRKRIASLSSPVEFSPSDIAVTTIDQKFMEKVMGYLEDNMDNEDYSVESLASDVGMHRMSLYRKIQSLTGMTPSEFIRSIRLKRAVQIMNADPGLNVGEVSAMVGFGSPKLFSQHFKEAFGVNPSKFHQQ